MGWLVPVLVGLLLLLSPFGRGLIVRSYDSLFIFRPTMDPAALSGTVILSMDEDSCRHLSQDPNKEWDRRIHARLLQALKARGARLVVFDVLFDAASPDPAMDAQFAGAIRQHGPVVVGGSRKEVKNADAPPLIRLLPPNDRLGTNVPWGVVEWPTRDQVIRQFLHEADYTNLAFQAAAVFGPARPRPAAAPWLNYYGPPGTIPTVSYYRALESNALPPDFFSGKAVFVGVGSLITALGPTTDLHPTPFSWWQAGQISGVELHATAFLNLVRNEWFTECGPLTELLMVVGLGALLGFLLPRFLPWTAAAVALTMAVLFAAGATALAWTTHYWFPWLITSAVQVPCALAWAWLAHTTRLTGQKESLERELALAESVTAFPLPRSESTPSEVQSALQTRAAGQLPAPAPDGAKVPPIPNHILIRRIGQGAYGEVWLAKDEIGTYHAVKLVYRRTFESDAPYEREFRGIQKFTPISRSHPGLVHILHVGRGEGYFFYIMELGDDELSDQRIDPATYSPHSLAKQLEGGRLSLPACVQLGLDLTAALEHLHQQHLVHRDIKPSNIIFVNRRPKFADIGLVTDMAAPGKEKTFVGTEGFIPPEGPGTAAADIYSLGKVLYEACTGRDREQFPSLSGTLVAAGSKELPMLNEVILKACQNEPHLRYQAASQMHSDLLNTRDL